ncbi:hypothetical protein DPMN_143750 [Dreissena polymorpha]|uniref:VWFA domain-containing protein n=2 Tax=Dreissena polymorpha TaxID=45954 RepID=A0A9D4JPL0_DREPO|nr:hypothetical protein DPMN_143750 [Dreissena polymorpha]
MNPSTHYMTTFLKEFVARLPIGPTGSLLGLALIDSDIHSVWSLIDHVTNDQLQMAINGIRFQHRKDRLDIENLVDYLSKEAFDNMSGDRPSVPNAVVIFVDHRGRPDMHHGHVSGLGADARHDVQKASGDVIVVNIGSTDHSAVTQMSVLATDAHHVFSVADYDALSGIKDMLVNFICN